MTRRGDPRTPGVGSVRGGLPGGGSILKEQQEFAGLSVLPATTSESSLSCCSPDLPLPTAEPHHPVIWGPPEKGQSQAHRRQLEPGGRKGRQRLLLQGYGG